MCTMGLLFGSTVAAVAWLMAVWRWSRAETPRLEHRRTRCRRAAAVEMAAEVGDKPIPHLDQPMPGFAAVSHLLPSRSRVRASVPASRKKRLQKALAVRA